MSFNGARITWQEYWGMRKQVEPEQRDDLDFKLGFEIDEELNHVTLYPRFQGYIDSCSVPELVECLKGAPLQITCLYIAKLPLKYAKQVVMGYRIDDVRILEAAYRKPPQIAPPAPEVK